MARKRIIYQSLALYAGQNNPSGAHAATDIKQLTRVQSWDSDFSRSFQDVNQYGQLAARDRVEIDPPTVNMKTSWYPTDGSNEKYIGLSPYKGATANSLISGILNKTSDERNFFLLVADEGNDAVGYVGATSGVIGIGNAFLTNYSLDFSVGAIPTASADFEALNFRVYNDANVGADVPAINPINGAPITGTTFNLPAAVQDDSASQATVLRPGDVTLSLSGLGGFSVEDLKIQSCKLAMGLKRSPISKLGSRFPYTREVDFPLTATVSVEAIAGDLANFNLSDMLCETGFYDLRVNVQKNACSGTGPLALSIDFKGAKISKESVTTSIGANVPVSIEYEVTIGSAQQLTKGIFMSGSYA